MFKVRFRDTYQENAQDKPELMIPGHLKTDFMTLCIVSRLIQYQ